MAGDHSQLPARVNRVRFIPEDAIVLPGLSDSHGHIFHYGSTRQLVLEGTASLEETVKLVRDFVLNNPKLHSDNDSFIFGSGWDHMSWSNT
jgi:predicted amidohydrolase YtcJ